jgi:hypothetical protein
VIRANALEFDRSLTIIIAFSLAFSMLFCLCGTGRPFIQSNRVTNTYQYLTNVIMFFPKFSKGFAVMGSKTMARFRRAPERLQNQHSFLRCGNKRPRMAVSPSDENGSLL